MSARRIFILGGTRSGKSSRAVSVAHELAGDRVTFVATARPLDEELVARIAAHQLHRPAAWPTMEAGADLAVTIAGANPTHALLIDSLTLWVSTLAELAESVEARWRDAEIALAARSCPAIVVSDEIGLGMVPLDGGARAFRDELGRLHQMVAASSDEVWLMVAGLPLRLKPS